ncbi:MAG: hypothetical protein M1825_005750 [Sarcosagium campestre]|nr:MAG: hypothetical protein M1825_005750 [Sarcosagium campestre]
MFYQTVPATSPSSSDDGSQSSSPSASVCPIAIRSPSYSSSTSPSTSPSSPSPPRALGGISSYPRTNFSTDGRSCAYPAWPAGSCLRPNGEPQTSSYISDADLFFDEGPEDTIATSDIVVSPRIRENRRHAPAPPTRCVEFALPQAKHSQPKPKKRKRSFPKNKPLMVMTPIRESPT